METLTPDEEMCGLIRKNDPFVWPKVQPFDMGCVIRYLLVSYAKMFPEAL